MATTARNQLRFITEEDKTAAEAQVRELQTDVDYETKEYTVELIVQKYQDGEAEDMNELFVRPTSVTLCGASTAKASSLNR